MIWYLCTLWNDCHNQSSYHLLPHKVTEAFILSGYFWWEKLVKYSIIQLLWESGPFSLWRCFSVGIPAPGLLGRLYWAPTLMGLDALFLLLFVYDLSCSMATTALHPSWVRHRDWHRLSTAHVSSTGTCHWGTHPLTNRSWGSVPWGQALEKVLVCTSFTIGKVAKCV